MEGELELAIYALPGGEPDQRTHVLPLFLEQMMMTVHRAHKLANRDVVRVREMSGENYIHRNNWRVRGLCRSNPGGAGRDVHANLLERPG